MRVLMFSWEFPPHVVGGLGKHVAELAPGLAGQITADGPIEIDLFTPHYHGGAETEVLFDCLTVIAWMYHRSIPRTTTTAW